MKNSWRVDTSAMPLQVAVMRRGNLTSTLCNATCNKKYCETTSANSVNNCRNIVANSPTTVSTKLYVAPVVVSPDETRHVCLGEVHDGIDKKSSMAPSFTNYIGDNGLEKHENKKSLFVK